MESAALLSPRNAEANACPRRTQTLGNATERAFLAWNSATVPVARKVRTSAEKNASIGKIRLIMTAMGSVYKVGCYQSKTVLKYVIDSEGEIIFKQFDLVWRRLYRDHGEPHF